MKEPFETRDAADEAVLFYLYGEEAFVTATFLTAERERAPEKKLPAARQTFPLPMGISSPP